MSALLFALLACNGPADPSAPTVVDEATGHTGAEPTDGTDTEPTDPTSETETEPSTATEPTTTDGCPRAVSVSDSPLVPLVGVPESTTADGFDDEYLYDPTQTIKVGLRKDWGGSIVFFGVSDGTPGTNLSNTIDANDTGREVQVAIYDASRQMQDCAWNASCQSTATTCPFSITYLGWNPVQGGNRCNNGSDVASFSSAGGALTLTTRPKQWNPNWDFSTCDSSGCDDPALEGREADVELTQTLRFVSTHVVELRYTLRNLGADDHVSTLQEMPTMYTANGNGGPDLWRLMDAGGNEVDIDTPGNDNFFYENFDSPGPWVTLQNDDLSYGVGILYENGLTAFQGWQNRSLPFNNVRAQFPFGLPPYGVVNARAYLLLGAQADIAAEAEALQDELAPFGWLDAPAEGAEVSGETAIGGWVLDNRGVVSVEAWIDGTEVVPLSFGTPRPDVCLVWPGYPDCGDVGFSGSYDFGAPGECAKLLEIVATDSDGNQRVIASRLVEPAP